MIRNAYGQYTITDYLNDEDFVRWAKRPSAEGDAYWQAVIATHPHQQEQIEQARELVAALSAPRQQRHEEGRERVWDHIAAGMQAAPVQRLRLWRRVAVAASITVLLAAGGYLYRHGLQSSTQPAQPAVTARAGADSTNQAVLTLANGQKIVLDSRATGVVADEGGASIRKTAEGEVAYTAGDEAAEVQVNQMATPAGGQYRLTLPDGTKVWLNALTSLRYPTRFTGNERRVELSGEAYFDVAQHAGMPFKVVSAAQEVEVLGTQFNINCYPDEAATSTTLLTGAVRVTNTLRNVSGVLKPGQLARVQPGGQPLQIAAADVEATMAWRDGYFIFDGESLEAIMRKIARWYDVQIVYEGPQPAVALKGMVSRSKKLQEVLGVMEITGALHFRIDGRKVVVTR